MKLFFDTSALVKYFHQEAGTQQVIELIEEKANQIWISDLSRLEFISSLLKKIRTNEINETQLELAISSFDEEFFRFTIIPVRETTFKEAEQLLFQFGKKWGLRTLDAMQLGAFQLIAKSDWIFVCADTQLCKVVEELGYKTIIPSDENLKKEV